MRLGSCPGKGRGYIQGPQCRKALNTLESGKEATGQAAWRAGAEQIEEGAVEAGQP